MMSMSLKMAGVAVAMLAMISCAEAVLTCYQCKDCPAPSLLQVKVCPDSAKYCTKGSVLGYIERGCDIENVCKATGISDINVGVAGVSCCSGQLCNSALGSHSMTASLLLLPAALASYLYLF